MGIDDYVTDDLTWPWKVKVRHTLIRLEPNIPKTAEDAI